MQTTTAESGYRFLKMYRKASINLLHEHRGRFLGEFTF